MAISDERILTRVEHGLIQIHFTAPATGYGGAVPVPMEFSAKSVYIRRLTLSFENDAYRNVRHVGRVVLLFRRQLLKDCGFPCLSTPPAEKQRYRPVIRFLVPDGKAREEIKVKLRAVFEDLRRLPSDNAV